MSEILLSICVPTRNRAPQLDWLLNYFFSNQSSLHNWEIVIADNASTDNTLKVCDKYIEKLPIKIICHDKDIGGDKNLNSAIQASSGSYCVYHADDDCMDIAALTTYLNWLNNNRDINVLYAPWNIVDQKGKKITQFYLQNKPEVIKKGDFSRAAQLIIENSIFPEIFIAKRDTYKKKLKENNIAYTYFSWVCQFIADGDVMFATEPFYNCFSQHPAGSRTNSQAGNEQTMTSWDLYRGGFEVLLGAAATQPQKPMEFMRRSSLAHSVNLVIRDRMVVALRLCINDARFLNGYWLYRRLLSSTPEDMLPIRRDELIFLASLEYVSDELSKDGTTIVLPENMPKQLRDFASSVSRGKYISAEQESSRNYPNLLHIKNATYAETVELLKF